MAKNCSIHNALPIVAAAYGEKFGVKVVIGDDMAYTDGSTIVLPNLPDDYPEKDVIWGYLAHEAAHVRFTDFLVDRRPGLHAHLTNIIEDCRIERAMIKLYPGTAYTLDHTARYMTLAGHYTSLNADHKPVAILTGYVLYWLQTTLVGQAVLQSYLDKATSALAAVFSPEVISRLNALLHNAVLLQSTAQAAALADDIIKMIAEEQQHAQSSATASSDLPKSQADEARSGDQPQSQADEAGSGDQPQSQADEASSGDQPQSQADEAGSGDQRQSQADEASSGDQPQSQPESTGCSEQPPPKSDDPGDQLSPAYEGNPMVNQAMCLAAVLHAPQSEMISDPHASLKLALTYLADQNGPQEVVTVRRCATIADDREATRHLMGEVRSTTSKIRAQLLGLVQASKREGHHTQHKGKRLDASKLHRIVTGDTRMFLATENRKGPNTAVHVLVDMSYSMTYASSSDPNPRERQDIARHAALAIAMALEAIPGVNPAVTFFCGKSEEPVYSAVKHGESVRQNAGRFGFRATGGTPMAEAMWYAAFELTKTREQRKMMIVVTDGEPSGPHESCVSIIERCANSIDIIAIGIETASVKRLFPVNIVIDDVADLQRTLFTLLEQSLTKPQLRQR